MEYDVLVPQSELIIVNDDDGASEIACAQRNAFLRQHNWHIICVGKSFANGFDFIYAQSYARVKRVYCFNICISEGAHFARI